VKQVLSGDWYHWEDGGYKERVQEVNMVEIIVYSCMKMEK
jgi:hypothetical protein